MKIPASPLLLGLAFSGTALAYPTPAKDRSPNPESSPLLSAPNTPNNQQRDDGWGSLTPKISRRWGKRQAANTQALGGPASGLLGSATGLFGSLTGGNAVQGASGIVGGLVKNPTGALDGLGLGTPGGLTSGVFNTLQGSLNGLPVVGGLANNLGSTVNGLPVVGGLVGSATGGGATTGLGGGLGAVTGTLNGLPVVGGLVGGLGGTVNGLPVVGGLASGLTGGSASNLGNTLAGSTGATQGLAPNTGSIGQVAGSAGSTGQQLNTAGVPTLLANLGDGRYLLSNGQILSLGNLGLGNVPVVGGLAGSLTSQPGNLGQIAQGSSPLSGLTGLAGQVNLGNAQQAIGGLAGSAAPGIGSDGLARGDAGKLVNIGGQLYPLDQARGMLHQHGLDGVLGQYTSDLTGEAYDEGTSTNDGAADTDHITPAQAFQAADPNVNGTSWSPAPMANSTDSADPTDEEKPSTASTQSLIASSSLIDEDDQPWSDADIEKGGRWSSFDHSDHSSAGSTTGEKDNGKGYDNPYPEYQYDRDADALGLVAGAMGGRLAAPPTVSSALPSTSSASTAPSGDLGAIGWTGKMKQGWERPGAGYSRPGQASSAAPTSTKATSSAPAATATWTSHAAPTPTPTPTPWPGTDASQDGAEDGNWDDQTWGDWVSAQAEPSAL